jgi:hypothetical protein
MDSKQCNVEKERESWTTTKAGQSLVNPDKPSRVDAIVTLSLVPTLRLVYFIGFRLPAGNKDINTG